MFEIEMKAHVRDRKEVTQKLNDFATYLCSRNKSDVYYTLPIIEGGETSVRLRTESITKNDISSQEITFTYKRKESITGEDGNSIEVNDENEISLSKDDAKVLEKLFLDIGKIRLTKSKIVENWELETCEGLANIELCTVPPLGDFLEIEVINEDDNVQKVNRIKDQIKQIFIRCGISLDDIENRYYSDMLKSVV